MVEEFVVDVRFEPMVFQVHVVLNPCTALDLYQALWFAFWFVCVVWFVM